MPNITEIDAAIAMAESETGVRGGNTKLRVCIKPDNVKNRVWTTDEDEFVKQNLGRLSDKEMARELGRTIVAVRLHYMRDLHLGGASRSSKLLTAEHIAIGLGCDGKTIHKLIDTGLMPGRRLPTISTIRVVDRLAFLKWICNPAHWIYFKRDRVGVLRGRGKRGVSRICDFAFWEDARKLVDAASKKWRDQWLTPQQAANAIGIVVRHYVPESQRVVTHPENHYVNKAILKGNLKATRWGNWWILKSDLPKPGMTINYRGDIVRKVK